MTPLTWYPRDPRKYDVICGLFDTPVWRVTPSWPWCRSVPNMSLWCIVHTGVFLAFAWPCHVVMSLVWTRTNSPTTLIHFLKWLSNSYLKMHAITAYHGYKFNIWNIPIEIHIEIFTPTWDKSSRRTITYLKGIDLLSLVQNSFSFQKVSKNYNKRYD